MINIPWFVIRGGAYSGDQTPSSRTLGTFNPLLRHQ
jgi:hypothetical protein